MFNFLYWKWRKSRHEMSFSSQGSHLLQDNVSTLLIWRISELTLLTHLGDFPVLSRVGWKDEGSVENISDFFTSLN